MKKVYISVPNTTSIADTVQNLAIARILTRRALTDGFAPFAPVLFYHSFLTDDVKDMVKGINCGLSYLECLNPDVDQLWVYIKNDITPVMLQEIACAEKLNIEVRRVLEL